jgi:hypothetical protein
LALIHNEMPRLHGALRDVLFSHKVYKKATMLQPNSLGSLMGFEPTTSKSTEMRYFCPGSILSLLLPTGAYFTAFFSSYS